MSHFWLNRIASLLVLVAILFAYTQDSVFAQEIDLPKTYIPSLKVSVCTAASPLQVNAADVVFEVSDLPPKYFLEYWRRRAWESTRRLQSNARTEFYHGDPDVGPTYLSGEVGIFCDEQIAADFWPTAKVNLRDGFPAISEEPKLEIGDDTYVIVYRYRHTVWYRLVFRQDNAVVFMHVTGRDGVLDLDAVESLADTLEENLNR